MTIGEATKLGIQRRRQMTRVDYTKVALESVKAVYAQEFVKRFT